MDALTLRRAFVSTHVPASYSPIRHVMGSAGFAVGGAAAALFTLGHVAPAEWLALPVALLGCNLFEYAAHRWLMHDRTRLLPRAYEVHTLRHHRGFDGDHMAIESARDLGLLIFAPAEVALFALATLPFLGLAALLASRNVVALAAAAILLHYVFYELAHLVSHLPDQHWLARGRLAAGFRRRHALHHGNAKICMNVTLPISDRIFGTLR